MTLPARVVAVLVGLTVMVLVAAALVREIVLAANCAVIWPLAGWWERLTVEPSWTTTGLAALACVAVAAGLLLLAVRQRSVVRKKPALITFDTEHGATNLDVPALERALRHRLEATVPGMRVRVVEFAGGEKGCRVRVDAEMPAVDLVGMQARAFAAIAPDLESLAGLRLEAVDMVADRLVTWAERT